MDTNLELSGTPPATISTAPSHNDGEEGNAHLDLERRPIQGYTGSANAYLGRIQRLKAIATDIDRAEWRNLSLHLYNYHKLRQRALRNRRKRIIVNGIATDSPSHDVRLRRRIGDNWLPSKSWALWPMTPETVPRELEDEYKTGRETKPWPYVSQLAKPSRQLEETILALILGRVKQQFRARNLPVRRESGPIDAPETTAPTASRAEGGDVFRNADITTDDEAAMRIAKPFIRHTIVQIERLLHSLLLIRLHRRPLADEANLGNPSDQHDDMNEDGAASNDNAGDVDTGEKDNGDNDLSVGDGADQEDHDDVRGDHQDGTADSAIDGANENDDADHVDPSKNDRADHGGAIDNKYTPQDFEQSQTNHQPNDDPDQNGHDASVQPDNATGTTEDALDEFKDFIVETTRRRSGVKKELPLIFNHRQILDAARISGFDARVVDRSARRCEMLLEVE